MRTKRDPSAYAFAVILDLVFVAGFRSLYEDLLHDLDALDAFPNIVAENHPTVGNKLIARLEYRTDVMPPAEHYAIPADATAAGNNRLWFDCFARWATFRDRHQPTVLLEMLS